MDVLIDQLKTLFAWLFSVDGIVGVVFYVSVYLFILLGC